MESNPQFNLRWNNHSYNIIQVFLEQLTNESLVDVTLSCQGQFIKVHKMVLSACSPYFQDLFSIHQAQHPVIILNGIKFHDLKMVVDFMYRGETRVLESELNDILAVAETLQIKGLSTVRNKYEKNRSGSTTESMELTNPNESQKSTRKRKRPSEGQQQDTQKVPRQEAPSTESAQLELTTPKSNHTKATTKIVTSKASSQPESSISPRASSPMSPSSGTSPSKPTSSKPSSPKVSPSTTLRVSTAPSVRMYSHKNRGNNEPRSRPVPEGAEEDTDALPFVQVSLSEASDDDIDLAKTIKVNPLFIRDIDDNDASWDDPARLVIDLPSEEAEENSDNLQGQHSVDENNESMVPSHLVKTKFVAKPKLKVRSTSELVGSSKTSQSSYGTVSVQETDSASEINISELKLMDQRRGHRIPRPPNAFMIFANEWRKKLALENPTESNKQISVRLGLQWKGMSVENKAVYFTASRKADEEHKLKYPNYFYSPKEARIRKSQMQALRQKHVLKALPLRKFNKCEKDPLAFSAEASDNVSSTACISDVTDSGITIKEELLDEETNQQNLEEEFLKMVDDGQVRTELHEDDGDNSSTDQAVDNGNSS